MKVWHEAATPALIIVGFLMMTQIRHIDFTDYEIGIPAFLTLTLMPFTYSIANGIGVGFIAWAVLRAASGRIKEISPLLWIVAAGFLLFFARGWIDSMIGVVR